MSSFNEQIDKHIKRATEKINQIRTSESLVFPLFTDLHTDDVGHEYIEKLIYVLKRISGEFDFDAVINLGDNFRMLGRYIHITNDELKARFERIFGEIHEAAKKPLINVNGNHDAIGTDFFKPDFWNDIVKGKYGNQTSVYDSYGSYYYMDYEKANTRLVILSLPYDSDIEAEMPTPYWGFGKAQLGWLKNTALNTTKDVIIITHVPFYFQFSGDEEATLDVWDGENAKKSYLSALCGEIGDLDEAMEIINEFDSRTDTRLVACLSGHLHEDSLWMPGEEKEGVKNPLPCCQVVTMASSWPYGLKVEREIEFSMDIVVWNNNEGKLHLVRIGDGEDRIISV